MLDTIQLSQQAMTLDKQRLEIINQNISNLNTPGYKRQIIEAIPFKSYLNQSDKTVVKAFSMHTQGSLSQSMHPYDVAISGQGFFEIQNEQGIFYTRRGDFHVNERGELTTLDGGLLMGNNGPIQFQGGKLRIDTEGVIYEDEHKVDQLHIVQFNNLESLTPVGHGLYQSDAPPILPSASFQVLQGFIEQSNTKSIDEMVELMKISRHFETTQHIMRLSNQLVSSAINQLGEGNV